MKLDLLQSLTGQVTSTNFGLIKLKVKNIVMHPYQGLIDILKVYYLYVAICFNTHVCSFIISGKW